MGRTLILNIYPYNTRIDLAQGVLGTTEISSEDLVLAESTYLPSNTPVEVIQQYSCQQAFIRWTEIRSWILNKTQDLSSVLPYVNDDARKKFLQEITIEADYILSDKFMDMARVNVLRWLAVSDKNSADGYIKEVTRFWKSYYSVFNITSIFCGLHPHSLEDLIGCLVAVQEGLLCRTLVGGSLNIFGLVCWESGHLLNIDCNQSNEIQSMISNYWQKSRQGGFYMGSGYMGAMQKQTNIGLSLAKTKILEDYVFMSTHNVSSLYTDLIREYQTYAISLDEAAQRINGRKCYYLPWQAQPEATTVPGAMEWHHQVQTTLIVREKIESDAILLVKEHPYQFLIYGELPDSTRKSAIRDSRDVGCYQKISDLHNTFILDLSVKSSAILNLLKPEVFASTGSTGMEAYVSGNNVHQLSNTLSLTGEFLEQEGLVPAVNIEDRLKRAITYFTKKCIIRQQGLSVNGTKIESGDLFETEAIEAADSNTLNMWCKTLASVISASALAI